MGKFKDLTGHRFTRLLVLKSVGKDKNGSYLWLCQCDCGNTTVVATRTLNFGHTGSCGCLFKEKLSERNTQDITGQRFGKLIAIHRARKNKWKDWLWLCLCDCGNKTKVTTTHLVNRHTKSCGNCQNRVNGIMASNQQIQIGNMLGGKVNYRVGRKFADVALPNKKILIEYDCWFWHGNKEKEDKERVEVFLNRGWRVFVIKSKNLVPKIDVIEKYLSLLEHKNYVELVMPDWGVGDTCKSVFS